MTGALVILCALIIIGVLLYVTDVTYFRHHHGGISKPEENNPVGNLNKEKGGNQDSINKNPTDEEICCGQHLICEKTSLTVVSDEIIYYVDEELDRYAGRTPDSYSGEEIEEFRDVLLTLLPQDVAGWARSITLRKISLPLEVRDELLLLVSELRAT